MSEEVLQHYGILRRSGRYPWGSGDNGFQRDNGFLASVDKWRKEGMTENQIAEMMGLSVRQYRAKKTIEIAQQTRLENAEIMRLKEKGMSNVAIGERMGMNESVIRSRLKPQAEERAKVVENTADMLSKNVDDKKYIDVGIGTERLMGIHKTQLDAAVSDLVDVKKTHALVYAKETQLGTGKETTIKTLVKLPKSYEDMTDDDWKALHSDVHRNRARN